MNFLFLVDRYDTWHIEKDTSFAFMLDADRKGHQVHRFYTNNISLENGKVSILTEHVTPQKNKDLPFLIHDTQLLTDKDIDVVFIRTDPPFDATYLMTTWLLEHLPERIPVINKPSSIRTCNEKIWAMRFPQLMPPTLVTGQEKEMLRFIRDHEDVVIKPTDGFGGKNIHILNASNKNNHHLLEQLSASFTKEIILQKYLPESKIGDKRVLLLDGDPIGAVLRVHGKEDFRNNFMAGGTAQKTKITERDKEITQTLKPFLKELGLYFVGIDIIGEHLTEVNVTSPTCLQEINTLENIHLEDQIITFAENLIAKNKNPLKI